MGFRAALDASVLVPMPLCDTLLHMAEAELFDPVWSARILEEVERALIGSLGIDPVKAGRRVVAMSESFKDAAVDPAAVHALERSMTNNPGDRHVLAAAVAGHAELVVTANLRHFPAADCAPFGVAPVGPDDFLMAQLDLDAVAVMGAIRLQSEELRNPSKTALEVVRTLLPWAPRFVAAVEERIT